MVSGAGVTFEESAGEPRGANRLYYATSSRDS